MNKKVLTICLTVLLVCSVAWIVGCEKKADHSGHDHSEGDHPAVKTCCGEDPSKCCGAEAAAEAEDVGKACPVDCTKPCCAAKDGEATACPADCTKPCCAKT